MSEYVLRTDNLSRKVGDKVIVDRISLDVEVGEIITVVGESGAGKSSFLRLINRLDEPTSGTVYLDDVDYLQMPPREVRRRVGMMMQSAYLFPGTVADNLRFGPRQHGQDFPDAMVDRLLERVGLPGFAARNVNHLSGGEAQRVSLARTLANRPEVLLLDEPTAALDDRTTREIEALLMEIVRDYHLTALMISHDADQAERIATRAILIDAGRLVEDGSVEEVLHARSVLR